MSSGLESFHRVATLAALMAFAVVVLGAWVRLTDAGLGCPDWPGCYGALIVPADEAAANALYPERPLERGKAWREMLHRYLAGSLGLVVLALAGIAVRQRHRPGQPVAIPVMLLALVVFQALLGMWTVTLRLNPAVVLAHLLGGMATLALSWWLMLETGQPARAGETARPGLRRLAALGLAVVALQIALGGWTSGNYAAFACPDFPTCQGVWWPEADFRAGFKLWQPPASSYEGGILEHPARVAVHLTHRMGALLALAVLGALSLAAILRSRTTASRRAGVGLALALVLQIVLGVSIVELGLPLGLAVGHNAVAAMLLLAVVTLNHRAGVFLRKTGGHERSSSPRRGERDQRGGDAGGRSRAPEPS